EPEIDRPDRFEAELAGQRRTVMFPKDSHHAAKHVDFGRWGAVGSAVVRFAEPPVLFIGFGRAEPSRSLCPQGESGLALISDAGRGRKASGIFASGAVLSTGKEGTVP